MSLRLELAPFERVILGNCDITNGPRRTELYIAKSGPVLRQKYILKEEEACTPIGRFYIAVQGLFLASGELETAQARAQLLLFAREVINEVPEAEPTVDQIIKCTAGELSFDIIKLARQMLDLERQAARSNVT